MIEDLEKKKAFIEKYAFNGSERFWHFLHHLFPKNSFLVCALDLAAWDIAGKMAGQPLFGLWQYDMANAPLTDYTIGIDTLPKMLSKIKNKPWPIYKIKVGTREDMATIRAIRNETDAVIRVDANAGWNFEEALQLVEELQKLNVELIEQPLHKDDWEGMRTLYAKSPVPLIADESCVTEQDVKKCKDHFHGVNIKLTKCGGITPAKRMIEDAKRSGMKVMIGSMNETSIGSAAIAHLMPVVDYADNDGPLLLAEDIATGLTYDKGRVSISNLPGLGIIFEPPS